MKTISDEIVLPIKFYNYVLRTQTMKYRSMEVRKYITKDFGNRKVKLARNGKRAVHWKVLERGGNKGFHRIFVRK